MKVMAEPIEVVSWTDKEGKIRPVRFRIQQKDCSYKTIKVDKILFTASEKLAGNLMRVFKCQSYIDGLEKLFELKYEMSTCRWILYKI